MIPKNFETKKDTHFLNAQNANSSVNDSRELWKNLWCNYSFTGFPIWDELCELVYNLLKMILNNSLENKLVLEVGSGTGRISLRLAKEGSKAILLDVSLNAIKASKNIFDASKTEGHYLVGDIFYLPIRDCSLNVVWSSGVIEHYSIEKMNEIVSESLRTVEKDGLVSMIIPHKNAFIYNLFRRLDQRLGRWKYGIENPISSKDFQEFEKIPIRHYSSGFIYQLQFVSIPIIGYVIKISTKALFRKLPFLKTLDRNLPGYLIAGLWKK